MTDAQKLPENRVYGPIRRHRTRPTPGEYPQPEASLVSEIRNLRNLFGDQCQDQCHNNCDGIYPRSGVRSIGPLNKAPSDFKTPAARSALQPPCLALSMNFSSTSARVSGAGTPPRIKGWRSSPTEPSRSVARMWPVKFFG